MYIVDKKNKIKQKAKIITRSNLAQQTALADKGRRCLQA